MKTEGPLHQHSLDLEGLRRPSLPCRAFLPLNGEKEAGRDAALLLQTLKVGENINDSDLSPRHYTGRNARQGNEGQR